MLCDCGNLAIINALVVYGQVTEDEQTEIAADGYKPYCYACWKRNL